MTQPPEQAMSAEQLFLQALGYHEQGDLDHAAKLYGAILDNDPNDIGSLYNLGILCVQRTKYDEAAALLGEVVRRRPDLAVAQNALGATLKHLDRLEEAQVCCREAVRLKPDYAEAHNTLGDTLAALGRWGEAEGCFHEALRLSPDYAEAHNNLGLALISLGRPGEAELRCRDALRLKPGNPLALANLGNALLLQGKFGEAAAAFGQAAALKPDHAEALENWFFIKQRICDWSDYVTDEARFRRAVREHASHTLAFRLLGVSSTAEEQFAYARQVAVKLAAVTELARFPSPPLRPRDRIRLGYLSSDFLAQPTAYLTVGLIEQHRRDRFEVIGYGLRADDGSAMRRRIVSAFDRFVDISMMQELDAARLIHSDALDILINLNGFKPSARPKIAAYRPAPIQVSYLGYPGTMGADFMDYVIVDRFVAPPDQQPFFSERLVHLPGCYQCNDDKRAIAERTPSRTECGLPAAGFVFCCFHDSYKITPEFFGVWMRLLHAVPGSALWLLDAAPEAKANLAREAAERGIAPERLVFAPIMDLPEHLARHRLADLYLDTLPCNAHTTASDALWAGLPVLTCAGATWAGRVAGSLLRAVGLDDLVTTSRDGYEALALRLAGDAELLGRLRARLGKNRRTFPLFDTVGSTRNIEAAYSQMCQIRREGGSPRAFSIPPSSDIS